MKIGAAIAGTVCLGAGVAALYYFGQAGLWILTALVVGPIIAHCVWVRIKKGYWPDY